MGKKVEARAWFTPRQEQLLRLVGENESFAKTFYLTGGTALSAVFYNHRHSEDVDFFTATEFQASDIANFLFASKKRLGYRRVEKIQTNVSGYKIIWDDQDYLLVDFVFYSFSRISRGRSVFGIDIDGVNDICANKLETILLRCKARDYIDLYTIIQREKYNFENVFELYQKKYETKISNIELVNAFLKVNEAVDYPIMKIKFDKKEMIRFFENEARKLGNKIFK